MSVLDFQVPILGQNPQKNDQTTELTRSMVDFSWNFRRTEFRVIVNCDILPHKNQEVSCFMNCIEMALDGFLLSGYETSVEIRTNTPETFATGARPV